MRIGIGWDRHRLAPGRRCVLGGVHFADCPVGPEGHSDGDAVVHAVIDAMLGAAALGDIGRRFPDDDPAWSGADSTIMLEEVVAEVAAAGWRTANLDVVVITEQPLLSPRVPEMVGTLADAIGIGHSDVSVKGTRGEGVGPEGRGECVTAQAAVLLTRTVAAGSEDP